MSKEKFKLSLDEMSSSQRTALLYLQAQINETKTKTVSKDEYIRLQKLVSQSHDENIETYKNMCQMFEVLKNHNIDEYKREINTWLEGEHTRLSTHFDTTFSEIVKREESFQENYVNAQKALVVYQNNMIQYFTNLVSVLKKSGIVVSEKLPVLLDREGNMLSVDTSEKRSQE